MTTRDRKGKPVKLPKRKPIKPNKPKKRPTDVNQLAHFMGAILTGETEQPKPTKSDISRVMAELGRRGGKIGGKARAAGMTPERRREIALKAAQERWGKHS